MGCVLRVQQASSSWNPTRRAHSPALVHITCAAAAVLLLVQGLPSAQDVTESALKAAYIYNFAKFTEWPAGVVPAAQPLALCVFGDADVGDALKRAVKDRVLSGHPMAVSHMAVTAGAPQSTCHVMYVSGVSAGQAAEVIAGVRDVPVLTLSDVEGFTERGGIAQFFFDNGQLHFAVQLESIRRARLRISSRLLSLARRR
jgi:hypothetical protein